jgi:hypothetical protein
MSPTSSHYVPLIYPRPDLRSSVILQLQAAGEAPIPATLENKHLASFRGLGPCPSITEYNGQVCVHCLPSMYVCTYIHTDRDTQSLDNGPTKVLVTCIPPPTQAENPTFRTCTRGRREGARAARAGRRERQELGSEIYRPRRSHVRSPCACTYPDVHGWEHGKWAG